MSAPVPSSSAANGSGDGPGKRPVAAMSLGASSTIEQWLVAEAPRVRAAFRALGFQVSDAAGLEQDPVEVLPTELQTAVDAFNQLNRPAQVRPFWRASEVPETDATALTDGTPISALRARLKGQHIVVVTGCGVSLALAPDHADVLLWDSFVRSLVRRVQAFHNGSMDAQFVNDRLSGGDLKDIAEQLKTLMLLQGIMCKTSADYHHFIMEMFEQVRPSAEHASSSHTSMAEAIRALGAPIITTNYDVLLDRLLNRVPINMMGELLRLHRLNCLNQFHPESNEPEKFVYHVHGIYSERDGFTLSDKEYKETAGAFKICMQALLGPRSMLFIGVGGGLTDLHFKPLLQKVGSTARHYWLLQTKDEVWGKDELAKAGITCVDIIPYGSRDDLTAFLWQLARDGSGFESTTTTVITRTLQEQRATTHTIITQAEPATKDQSLAPPDVPTKYTQTITKTVVTEWAGLPKQSTQTIKYVPPPRP